MRTAAALLLAFVISAGAGAQTVTMPKEVKTPVGRLATVIVKSDGADTKYFADDGLDVFREYDTDPAIIRLRVIGYAEGKYSLRAITCRDNKLSEPATVTVVIGTPPPVVDPVKPDPVKPDPKTVYYFAVIRPDQATQDVADAMRLPAWDEVRKAGHLVKDIPLSELPGGLDRPPSVPVLVTLRRNADGKTWTDTKQNKPMPTTDAQVRELLK